MLHSGQKKGKEKKNLFAFLCALKLCRANLKGDRLIDLEEEISTQSNIQAMAWRQLAAFSQKHSEDQEQNKSVRFEKLSI